MPHPTDANCIFCKIIAGQIPCHKLFEDEHVLAFLDVGPLSRGHSLVIPKGHWATIDQADDAALAACIKTVKRLSIAVKQATGAAGWNVLQNNGAVSGQAVGHVHFHIIPRDEGDGLGYRWNAGKLSDDAASELVEKITGALAG